MPFGWNYHISGNHNFHTKPYHHDNHENLYCQLINLLSSKSNLNSILRVNIGQIAPISIVSGQELY